MVTKLPQVEAFRLVVIDRGASTGAKKYLVFLKLADVVQLSHRVKSENNDMVFPSVKYSAWFELIMRTL